MSMEDRLLQIAGLVSANKYLNAIRDAFSKYMPFVIVGSFGSLLNTIICSPTTGLAAVLPAAAELSPAFSAINFCCLSFMTIPVLFLIAQGMGKHNGTDPLATGIVAIAGYISMVPTTFSTTVDLVQLADALPDGVTLAAGLESAGVPVSGLAAMANTIFGAQGLFVGMISAILIANLFGALCKIDAIRIKLPESVPAGIAASFNLIVPVAITLIITSVFGWGFRTIIGLSINEWVYSAMQAPMEALFQTLPGACIAVALSQVFWFLGIHGGLVVSPVRNAIWASAIAANVASAAAGAAPDQIFTMGFWMCFIVPGGAGMTLALILAIFLFSRREDHRAVAKLALAPGLLGISEPVVFAMPLVLNPLFAIPFVFNSAITCAIGMIATNIGFLPCNTFDVPFGVPVILNAFMSYGWQGVVVQVICFAVAIAVWAPFVLAANRQPMGDIPEQG
ncbi:MAG: PTS transporter subunit EIIC [Acidobacteriota bacterium]|nr:PTS transporter subunit EIIC [Acidobacteriota bacterium]